MNAYEEVVDWIARGPSSRDVAEYQASPSSKERAVALLRKEKFEGLLPEEKSELDHFAHLEHIMRLAKARAQQFVTNE